MRTNTPLALFFSALLQVAPWFQGLGATAVSNGSQIAITILRWVVGGTAVSGVFHGVSGASIVLTSPAGGSVRATNGVDVAFRVSMTYTEGSSVSTPAVYDAVNLPPGLNPPSKSGTIWRITGRPTQSGVFSNVKLTGYEKTTRVGHQATVPLTITVVDAVPEITVQPLGLSVKAGQSATLSVTATGGSLTYQWLKGDLEIPNASSATLTFPAAKESDAGIYRVRIGNSGGSIVSSPAVLAVTPGAIAPQFTATPAGQVVHAGEPILLSAIATGDGPLVWAWAKDGIQLGSASAASLLIPAAAVTNSGNYSVTATGPGGTASSPAVRVAVVAPLQISAPSLNGNGLVIGFSAIPKRGYFVEEALPENPAAWVKISESFIANGGADQTVEVPLQISIPEPKSGTRLYRIRTQ